ncbi:hypothetical protein [Parvicella tangerina]|uniref:Uncharacterized protein n=1 Tax=Parvicella tangerina TaxID=2829795 RepID=A0A916JPW5_9FLAO|nr:hypothetical protein [Parvicella tangerina]CAG5086047.1 hypothetical protein CRYO30217_02989 [Parvicella tangerina]
MARQKGIIKLEGKIGDLSFYKSKDGYLAREKGGVDADRIKKDPAFERTRENGSEFGGSAKSGKLLRDAIRTMMQNASDNRVTSRLTKLMTQIKNLDTTSVRGKRNVGVGIANANAKLLLKDFNFNENAVLGSILFNPYDVDVNTGVINLVDLIPINDLNNAPGATHITLRGAWAKVDFATGDYDVQESNAVNLPIDGVTSNVVLTPNAAPAGSGTDLYLLMVEFFQEVNGDQYTLKNGAYNALSIVEVQ